MEREFTKSSGNNPFSVPEELKQATSPFSIDGYDSDLLEDRAYLKLDDEMLKLEYQINKLEENLAIINDEIKAAINIDDNSRRELLLNKKNAIENELKKLNDDYFGIGTMSKLTSIISAIFKKRPSYNKSFMENVSHFISKYVLSIFSKRLNFTFGMRDSLSKLSDINRNVDELISLRIPFGGLSGRYEQLSSYIKKANVIHAQISQKVDDFEGKEIKPHNPTEIGNLLDIKQ